ncbi:hypothetical protein E1171_10445, partial [Cytophagales bacterium RKSG123]|nr:hypothetical protein [Xanthovirga aplysinae]
MGERQEVTKMKHFFKSNYPQKTNVDLLTFYEDYYREFKKPEEEFIRRQKEEKKEKEKEGKGGEGNRKENLLNSKKSPFYVETLEQQRERIEKWEEKFSQELKISENIGQETVQINLEMLKRINAALDFKSEKKKRTRSHGAFLQVIDKTPEGKLNAVVNGAFSGYGKMLSRFLHIFDEKITQDTCEANRLLMKEETLFLENSDASYFNANLHPPLMPYEIWSPGAQNSLPSEKQLAVTDFEVRYDSLSDELILVHKPTQNRAFVFDLCFQSQRGRSKLFQLLDNFTDAAYLSPYLLINAINKFVEKENKKGNSASINIYPRVVFENSLIIQRKRWEIGKAHMPQKLPQESDSAFFYGIKRWKDSFGIPDEVFVILNP